MITIPISLFAVMVITMLWMLVKIIKLNKENITFVLVINEMADELIKKGIE